MNCQTLCGFAATLAMAGSATAIETTNIELREGTVNDGAVSITRSGGELVFDDAVTTQPVTLQSLLSITSDHGTLTGLNADDHTHYLNDARHEAAHDALFNDGLAISPDRNGNTTLSSHAADSDIHLSRDGDEVINGDWFFGGEPEFGGGMLWLSAPGLDGTVTVRLRDSSGDGLLTWNPVTDELSFNRVFAPDDVQAESLAADFAVVTDTLTGTAGPFRTGRISGFSTIEGIAWNDLLSRSASEDISGAWDFLAPVRVVTSASGSGVTGLYAMADNAAANTAAVGVAGVAGASDPDAGRIGVLGALDSAWVSNAALLPEGPHAGAFLGDVHVEGTANVSALAIHAVAGEAISAGDVVEWGSSGTVFIAGNGATTQQPFAGVALEAAAFGDELRIGVGGIVPVTITNAIVAGSVATWDGSSLVLHSGGGNAALGVVINSYAGGGITMIDVQIMPGMFSL